MLKRTFLISLLVLLVVGLTTFCAVAPVVLMLFFPLVLMHFGFWSSMLLSWLAPFGFATLVFTVYSGVSSEYALVCEAGRDHALWSSWADVASGVNVPARFKIQHLVIDGWEAFNEECFQIPILGFFLMRYREEGSGSFRILASRCWSDYVIWLHDLMYSWQVLAMLPLVPVLALWVIGRRIFGFSYKVFWTFMIAFWFLFTLPYDQVAALYDIIFHLLVTSLSRGVAGEWLLPRYLSLLLADKVGDLLLATHGFAFWVRAKYSDRVLGSSSNLTRVFQSSVMKAVMVIDNMRLPAFIRNRFSRPYTVEDLAESRRILSETGWPVNVEITDADLDATPNTRKFADWLIAGTDLRTGIKRREMAVAEKMDALRVTALQYRRTEEYKDTENELEATSRYFSKANYDYPDLDVSEVWEVIGDIFRHSKLTPFNYIIAMWEKRYALGFWFKDPRSNKKLSRRSFINRVGYKAFKDLWRRTFIVAPRIAPVAHISPKDEALPPKKWAENKIRSIVGSPLSQYILSTVFNYGPNHNFAWESTPIKIGMPLNGYWMSRVWGRHSRFDMHMQGDMTAFDSTVQSTVVRLIAEVRKKGYDFHKDKRAICELIDINYDQVLHQPLGFTSTGNIFTKGTGLTTGHSSTSMDNSVALVTLYLMAWKDLTGLSAKEFLSFNELSCFGDDHMLSYASVRPLAWSPSNIAKTMAKWGVTNRVEPLKLWDMSFLSKFCRPANVTDRMAARRHKIDLPPLIVFHDREKLVGKLLAPVKHNDANYRVKRLLSYLDLTAHHEDIYEQVVSVINDSKAMKAVLRNEGLHIPTYRSVLKRWYESQASQPAVDLDGDDDERFINDGGLLSYGTPTMLDDWLNALSMVPDLLNPVVFNLGYSRSLQQRLGQHVLWPLALLMLQNNVSGPGSLKYVADRTPYRFLDTSIAFPDLSSVDFTSLLVRHWLFLCYDQWRPTLRGWRIFAFVVSKVSNWQFALNGVVQLEAMSGQFNLDKLIVIALLSGVRVPNWLPLLSRLRLPDVGLLLDLAWNWLLTFTWQKVPTNYNEVGVLLKTMKKNAAPILVQAPTGTGKSTSMIAYFRQHVGHLVPKIVVIEPRSILVKGLTTYMSGVWGDSISGSTTGLDLNPDAKVWYVTPASFMTLMPRIGEGSVVVLDEAHLTEPSYELLKRLLPALPFRPVFTTATPSEALFAAVATSIAVPIVSLWKVQEEKVQCEATTVEDAVTQYLNFVKEHRASCSRSMKVMYILDTPSMCESLTLSDKLPAQSLSAYHSTDIDDSVCRYYATNIVDVGVTIPDLDMVVTPDWSYVGQGQRTALSSSLYKQRRGRVGRTRNGHCIVYQLRSRLFTEIVDNLYTPENFSTFLSFGVSPLLLSKIDKRLTFQVLGLSPDDISDSENDSILRSAHVFLQNLKPLAIASVLNEQGDVSGSRLVHTGSGHISTTFNWSLDEFNQALSFGLQQLLKTWNSSGFNGVEGSQSLWERLTRSAGPFYAPANLLSALQADPDDGSTDLANPKNALSVSIENIYELRKIQQILSNL